MAASASRARLLSVYIYLLLALLALPLTLRAQADFRPGFVVLPGGDTLRGRVDVGQRVRNPFECRFRPEGSRAVQVLGPANVRGFGIWPDELYHAQRVPSHARASDTITQRRFLEVLVQGAATLYRQADGQRKEGDERGDQYFIRAGAGPARPLLVHTERYRTRDGIWMRQQREPFRAVLAEVFGACPEVQRTVATVVLRRPSLVRVVQQFNACVGGPQLVVEVDAPRRRSYFLWEAQGGLQASRLYFTGDIAIRDRALPAAAAPMVGVATQYYGAGLRHRWLFGVAALYESEQYNLQYETEYASPFKRYQQARVRTEQVRLPFSVRYLPLASSRLRPFVEVGTSLALALTSANAYRYRPQPTGAYSAWEELLPNPRRIEQGLFLGVGGSLQLPTGRHFSATLRAERTNGFSDAFFIETHLDRLYLLLSYDLSRPRQ